MKTAIFWVANSCFSENPTFSEEAHFTSIFRADYYTREDSSRQKACLFFASFLLGLLFDPEDGGDIVLRNVGLFWRTRIYIPEDRNIIA
jgi:hypothetical protein